MEVSIQLYAPAALLQKKEPPTGGWMGPWAGIDAVAKRKNSSPCRESNPGCPDPSLVTILTELEDMSRLLERIICRILNVCTGSFPQINKFVVLNSSIIIIIIIIIIV
jgi:hypothetical protein